MKIQLRTNEITLRRPIQNKKMEGGGEGRRKEKKEHLGKGGEGGVEAGGRETGLKEMDQRKRKKMEVEMK